ncbi:hypothetical protein ACW9HW_13450 [Pseudomonas sp. SDO5532_S415]
MAFEALTHLHDFEVKGFPAEWLPLTHLYDPDLPLFPILYFHELDPLLKDGQRPGERDRIFGYVYSVSLIRPGNTIRVTLATNKNLSDSSNKHFIAVAENAASSRLGLDDPVTQGDISRAFVANGSLNSANQVIYELWQQVVTSSFGGKLPFGKCWDPVFGLARFIASWNSDGGRKGELIQLHSYAAAFGQKISVGNGIHADFYLLPTWCEFINTNNPLAIFPRYASLVGANGAAAFFANNYTRKINVGGFSYSRFELLKAKQKIGLQFKNLNTSVLVSMMNLAPKNDDIRKSLFENYNAFNRGPQRAVLSLLMHYDLRNSQWSPEKLTQQDCVAQYTCLKSSYQSPKVMQLYAQQCFGAETVLPIDNWIEVFLKTPLAMSAAKNKFHGVVFSSSLIWGKVERLIWMAVQSRKVHASVAENILWCVRYGGPNKKMRSANPLGCKVCDQHIRDVCPAYAKIKNSLVAFNKSGFGQEEFLIVTNEGDNNTQGQFFVSCTGRDGSYDEYTPKDKEGAFSSYPDANHVGGGSLAVHQFVSMY